MGEIEKQPNVTAALEKLKAAAESKHFPNLIAAGKEFIHNSVLVVQKFSEEMEKAGEVVSSEDKKAAVIKSAQDAITPLVNKALDLPFLNEDQEAGLINKIIEGFISRTIDAAVAAFKKKGWVIS